MKWIANIFGVLLILSGTVWFLQGTNILPVGGMAGQGQWTVIGLIGVVVGIGLLVFINQRKPDKPG